MSYPRPGMLAFPDTWLLLLALSLPLTGQYRQSHLNPPCRVCIFHTEQRSGRNKATDSEMWMWTWNVNYNGCRVFICIPKKLGKAILIKMLPSCPGDIILNKKVRRDDFVSLRVYSEYLVMSMPCWKSLRRFMTYAATYQQEASMWVGFSFGNWQVIYRQN